MELPKRVGIAFIILSLAFIFGLWKVANLNLADVLVAWGTLLLAVATFSLIVNSNKQEKQRRKDEANKNNRDRKERYLNEIIQWANDVNSRLYDIGILTGIRYTEERNILFILAGLGVKGKYIKTIAAYIFGNPLTDSIKATGNAMGIYAETIRYFVERKFEISGMPDNERDRLVKELDEAIAEDHRNSKRAIHNSAKEDAIIQKRAESLRDKALITLDICAALKDDLLIK